MTANNTPGLIGRSVPFGAGATIDSDLYVPRNGCTTLTLMAVPTQAGTIMPRVRTPVGDFDLAAAATAVVANDLGIVQVDYALSQIGTVYVRYVNTDATAGSCSFLATDGGGR